jgi:hypothetical protein
MSTATALRSGAHLFTPDYYSRQLRTALTAENEVEFGDLKPGWYFYPGYSGELHTAKIVCVASLSPAGKKAVFHVLHPDGTVPKQAAFMGNWRGKFHPIKEDLARLCLEKHRDMVCEAKSDEVPNAVRRHYPELFVEIPSQFKAEDVASKLTGWHHCSTQAEFERCLESAHRSIRHHDKDSAPWIVSGNAAQLAHDRERESLVLQLQFWLWLIPLVSPGGVFYIPPKEAP